MSDKKNNTNGGLAGERSKKLKELAIEELRNATYYSPEEEFDPDRAHALVKVISKDEFIPDAYKGDAFLKRFRALHSDLFTDDQTKNNDSKDKEPELGMKAIQNQDIDKELEKKLLKSRELDKELERKDKELERKADLLKDLDRQVSQKVDNRFILFKNKKLARLATAVCVLLIVFGAMNIVTYASGKQSAFEVMEKAVDRLMVKINGSEYVDDEYQAEFDRDILDVVDYSEVRKYFNRKIYLPSTLPEIIVASDVTYTKINEHYKVYVNYVSEDQKEYILMELCEENSGNGLSDILVNEDNIYSEHSIRIADSKEIIYVYESDEFNSACFIFNDILYFFRYNISTEQFINIIKTMEAY